jgi:hypothetical protein
MPKPSFPADGGALPTTLHLSTLIRDPFVRRAFEREDGTAPAIAAVEPRRPLQGGAEASRELADA